ncbi:hypothetical protein CRENBAI_002875 [Crenichthys baileyi]|uniref:Uncharacterized protein n=1 Tax=Crenichthys baileyi TaxID=28760 RepID=A0AAV9RAM6_9TELE
MHPPIHPPTLHPPIHSPTHPSTHPPIHPSIHGRNFWISGAETSKSSCSFGSDSSSLLDFSDVILLQQQVMQSCIIVRRVTGVPVKVESSSTAAGPIKLSGKFQILCLCAILSCCSLGFYG